MESSSEEEGELTVKEEIVDDLDLELWNTEPRNRGSAFSPCSRGGTVLTNLQRGNMPTQTTQIIPDKVSLHVRSAMGDLTANDFRNGEINPDEVDSNGFTPIMWAASYGQLPTVRILIQRRAKVDYEGEDGETALLLASSNGHHEVIRLLLSCGANPNHEDHMGNTALMFASHNDRPHCVSELLEHGADFLMTNVEGVTAYNIAVKYNAKQAQVVLERYLLRLLDPS